MTREELLQQLSFLSSGAPLGIEVYFVLRDKDAEGFTVRFADLDADARKELLKNLKGYLDKRFLKNPDAHFGPLSEADDRNNAVYYYDLTDVPEDLACMDEVLNEVREEFTFSDDDLKKLDAFVFVIGNEDPAERVVIYKKHYPVSLIRRDSFLGLVQSDHRFVRMDGDIIKVNDTFEFIKIGEELFVFNVKLLERFHGFDGILTREAQSRISLIRAAGLVENLELLEAFVEDRAMAKRLLRAKRAPLVLSLTFKRVQDFIKSHPKLMNRIRFNATNDKIRLDTKVSQQLFIKLLDDDFLKSELTDALYDSSIKETLTDQVEQEDELD